MRILEINVCSGCLSTGTIAARIAKDYESNGNPCIIAYGRDYKDIGVKTYKIGTAVSVYLDFVLTRLFDNAGFNSKRATRKFIKWAEEYDPDVLWLHNLHGYYINIELLFNWIKTRPSMEVKWTLHDCWAFTGHCAHFKIANCYKWEKECNNCPQRLVYPKSILFDGSKNNYNRKKRIFSGVNKMTIITPSDWLRKLVKNSFLQDYNIEVVKNDIDRTVFSHRDSNFRKKYSLTDKKVILGVASSWSKGKGLNDFIELEKLLDNSYTIVLVGTDRRARKELPNSMRNIMHRLKHSTWAKNQTAGVRAMNR